MLKFSIICICFGQAISLVNKIKGWGYQFKKQKYEKTSTIVSMIFYKSILYNENIISVMHFKRILSHVE